MNFHRSISSGSGGGKNGEGAEECFLQSKTELEESNFLHNLQTSNFCLPEINRSKKRDGKYEEKVDFEKESSAIYHQHQQQEDMRKVKAAMDDEREEPEDLTSSIEKLRRFALLSHFS